MITTVVTENASPAGGHYSQAVVYNNMIFVSGQLGFEPGSNFVTVGSIEEQTKNCLGNLEQILLAANSDLKSVIKTTIYISDVELWPKVNAVYAEVFKDH